MAQENRGFGKVLGRGLGTVLPLVGIVAALGYVAWSATERARDLDTQTRCARNLLVLARALSRYQAAHGGACPDVYEEGSVSWYDVGNTRTDAWNVFLADADPGDEPASPPPSEPASNQLAVQSNTANLWALIHYGAEPEDFICPATEHFVDRVDVDAMRAEQAAWEAAVAAAREAVETARKEAERKAAEALRRRLEKARRETEQETGREGEAPDPEAPPEEADLDEMDLEHMILGKEVPHDRKKTAEKTPARVAAAREELARLRDARPDVPRDFRGDAFCSYSYQNVFGRFTLSTRVEAADQVAVIADANPLRRNTWSGPSEEEEKKRAKLEKLKGTDEKPGRLARRVRRGPTDARLAEGPGAFITESTDDLEAGWNAKAKDLKPWELNSPNHAFTGQNVLYLDGHVAWTTHPYCGPDWDNIWIGRTHVPRRPHPEDLASLREYNAPATYDGRTGLLPEKVEGDEGDGDTLRPRRNDKDASETFEPEHVEDAFLVP